MTREEHLAWCKNRAFEYCDTNNVEQAIISLLSDMNEHDETKSHPALRLMTEMLFAGHLDTVEKLRRFIEGFN